MDGQRRKSRSRDSFRDILTRRATYIIFALIVDFCRFTHCSYSYHICQSHQNLNSHSHGDGLETRFFALQGFFRLFKLVLTTISHSTPDTSSHNPSGCDFCDESNDQINDHCLTNFVVLVHILLRWLTESLKALRRMLRSSRAVPPL
jgi:hypothetical protein